MPSAADAIRSGAGRIQTCFQATSNLEALGVMTRAQ